MSGYNYCWAFSTTDAVLLKRHKYVIFTFSLTDCLYLPLVFTAVLLPDCSPVYTYTHMQRERERQQLDWQPSVHPGTQQMVSNCVWRQHQSADEAKLAGLGFRRNTATVFQPSPNTCILQLHLSFPHRHSHKSIQSCHLPACVLLLGPAMLVYDL